MGKLRSRREPSVRPTSKSLLTPAAVSPVSHFVADRSLVTTLVFENHHRLKTVISLVFSNFGDFFN